MLVVAGPVAGAPGTDPDTCVRAIAALGPDYRVGLLPDPGSCRWRVGDGGDCRVVTDVDAQAGDVAATIQWLAESPTAAPLTVGLVDGYVLLRIDHGLGDGRLFLALAAAIASSRADGLCPGPSTVNTRFPVARVLVRDLVSQPVTVARQVAELAAARRRSTPAPAAAGSEPSSVAAAGAGDRVRTVFGSAGPEYLSALQEFRRGCSERPSVGALLAYAVCDAFGAVEPRLADTVGIVTDLRSRLPAGRDTFANLCAVVQVPIAKDRDTFVRGFTSAVRSPAVSAQLALALLLATVRRGRVPRPGWDGSIALTLSDLSRPCSEVGIDWATGATEPVLALGVPTVDGHQIGVVISQAADRVQLTVRHDETVVPAATIARGVRAALSPDQWVAGR